MSQFVSTLIYPLINRLVFHPFQGSQRNLKNSRAFCVRSSWQSSLYCCSGMTWIIDDFKTEIIILLHVMPCALQINKLPSVIGCHYNILLWICKGPYYFLTTLTSKNGQMSLHISFSKVFYSLPVCSFNKFPKQK